MADDQLTDKNGAPVSVAVDQANSAYVIMLDDGTVAGRTFFMAAPEAPGEWIFYHTEVSEEFGGRALATVLIAAAMADVRAQGITVVPICPMVRAWLQKNAEEYEAAGGRVRKATGKDMEAVEDAVQGGQA